METGRTGANDVEETCDSLALRSALHAIEVLLVQVQRQLAQARRNVPVVRVVRVASDEADLDVKPLVPTHKCGSQCDDTVHEVTDYELRIAYIQARNRLRHVKYLMGCPLDDDDDQAPTYDELVAQCREHAGAAT